MTDERPWAEVQHEPCAECGFDPDKVAAGDLPEAVRGLSRRYQAPFTRFLPGEDGDDLVRSHPVDGAWSALEYACHVRDVLSVFADRIEATLHHDEPELGWWDHEAAVADDDYAGEEPTAVIAELAANAERLANVLAGVPADGWQRRATRRGTEEFTVIGLGRFALHEGSHHLLDVGRTLRAARGR